MVGGLLRCHPSSPNLFFDYRVIFGFAMQLTVRCEPVKSRVTHVPKGCNVAVNVQRDDGGAIIENLTCSCAIWWIEAFAR